MLTCGILLGLAYLFGVPMFLQRDDDPLPSSADAAVALAGSENTVPAAQKLLANGVVPTLVVTADRSGRDERRLALCKKPAKNVICIEAGPNATLGEARVISELATRNHWTSVVIVAPQYSLFRADRIFERCVDARIIEHGVDEPWWRNVISVPLEWIRLGVSETVRRRC